LREVNVSSSQIAVIILTMNQRERTLDCLDSLRAITQSAFRILVWDNGSHDGTVEAVHNGHPDVIVHHHPENIGVASGRNAAAQLAIEGFHPSYLLFLDNDILVEPGFVRALFAPFAEDPDLGQTQAKLRFTDDRERLNDAGGARINFILWESRPVGYGEIDRGQYDTPAECVACGGAMMVRADVFRELGGFDPVFDPFGPEDADFSLRLQRAGYRALYVPQAVAYHAVSHTFGEGYTAEYARHKLRHWYRFMRRHATPLQQLGFWTIGAPYLAIRVLWREVRRGNLDAIWGLGRGARDVFLTPHKPRKRGPSG
jgi:GT2 family glycosyltransferase